MIIPPMVKVILLLTKSASLFRGVELFGEVFESMISQGLKRNKIKLIFKSFKDKSFPRKRWEKWIANSHLSFKKSGRH